MQAEFEILIDDKSMEYRYFKIGDRVKVVLTNEFKDFDYIWLYFQDRLIIRQAVIFNDVVKLIEDQRNPSVLIKKNKLNVLGKVIF